jgi:hypothetical protein
LKRKVHIKSKEINNGGYNYGTTEFASDITAGKQKNT